MAVSKSWRGLVSMVMFASGLISALTGIILYIVPEGRIANWTIWHLFGVTKEGWQSIHTNSSLLMLIFGVLHVINNWGSIKNYVVRKTGGINQGGNLAGVSIVALVIILGGVFALPPVQWVMDAGESIKEMWVSAPDYEPPFGHAEELSLSAFCRRMYIDVDKARDVIEEAGLEVRGKNQTLSEIAEANGRTPMDVYMLIKHLEEAPKVEAGQSISAEDIEVMFGAGTGAGRKPVAEIAEAISVPLEKALERLAAAGIEAQADSLIKDLKDAGGLNTAAELVMIIAGVEKE